MGGGETSYERGETPFCIGETPFWERSVHDPPTTTPSVMSNDVQEDKGVFWGKH